MEYTIGKVQRTNFVDETGHAVDGYRVFYTMADGTVDYVEVEKNRYDSSIVKNMIEDEIKVHVELRGG
jgi:hypothetical protein